jgi:Lrp/AsnC family transcriptional regulator, regulator for asnA, asnC and gidA
MRKYCIFAENMEKLGVRDRKILYHLDLNSRQSFSQLGKKIGLHKDVVAYRVNKLREKGIIKCLTSINEYQLGLYYLRVCFTFQYVTPTIKQEIIKYFMKNKYTVIIHESEGTYDLKIVLAIKNVSVFYPIWYTIISKYRDFISNLVFFINCETIEYTYSFLLDEEDKNENNRVRLRRHDTGTLTHLDDLDYKILTLLSNDARIPTHELAEKLKITVTTINHRIKKMITSGVILGFRLFIDYSKIGYNLYTVNLCLKDMLQMQQIVKYVELNPHLFKRILTLGPVDLEFMFFFENNHMLHDFIDDVYSKFPGAIKNITSTTHVHTYKYQCLPDDNDNHR